MSKRAVTLSKMMQSKIKKNHMHIFMPVKENLQSLKKNLMRHLGGVVETRFGIHRCTDRDHIYSPPSPTMCNNK